MSWVWVERAAWVAAIVAVPIAIIAIIPSCVPKPDSTQQAKDPVPPPKEIVSEAPPPPPPAIAKASTPAPMPSAPSPSSSNQEPSAPAAEARAKPPTEPASQASKASDPPPAAPPPRYVLRSGPYNDADIPWVYLVAEATLGDCGKCNKVKEGNMTRLELYSDDRAALEYVRKEILRRSNGKYPFEISDN